MDSISVGSGSPYVLRVVVRSRTIDLSAVTSAVIRAKHADSTTNDWAASLSEQNSKSVMVSHPFDPGDIPTEENISLQVRLTIPGGLVLSEVTTLRVVPAL